MDAVPTAACRAVASTARDNRIGECYQIEAWEIIYTKRLDIKSNGVSGM